MTDGRSAVALRLVHDLHHRLTTLSVSLREGRPPTENADALLFLEVHRYIEAIALAASEAGSGGSGIQDFAILASAVASRQCLLRSQYFTLARTGELGV